MLIRHAARGLFGLAASILLSAPAHAQLFRAYLSLSGSDANPCTLQSPCRLLPAGLNAVANGGEIWLLDSANYNTTTVNITKSVTILAVPGAVGSVVSNGGDAIDISTPGVNVALRNLNIIPLIVGSGTPGMRGVFLQAGSSLIVENCLIANINGDGIDVNSATSVNLRVASSTVRGNNGIGIGILGVNTAVTTTFDVIDTNIDGNTGAGMNIGSLTANAAIKGAVRNSRISQNGYNGITLESDASAIVTVTVSHTSITNNATTGILSNLAPTKVFVAGSTIAGNGGVGLWAAGGGIVESAGNNEVRNNDGGNATGITAPGLM